MRTLTAIATLALAACLLPLRALAHPHGNIAGRVEIHEPEGHVIRSPAVVYIEQADPSLWSDHLRSPAPEPRLAMERKRFSPRVLPILAGDEVDFPNLDPVYHNVFSRSGTNDFDLGLYKDGKSVKHTFERPGVVRTFCNIHPHMTAYVLVLQNPWFTTAAADGSFTIAGVHPGRYTLRVWHERGGEAKQEIELKSDETVSASFALDATGHKRVPHKNKFGKPYSKGRDY